MKIYLELLFAPTFAI